MLVKHTVATTAAAEGLEEQCKKDTVLESSTDNVNMIKKIFLPVVGCWDMCMVEGYS